MADTTQTRLIRVLKFPIMSKNALQKNEFDNVEQEVNMAIQELAKQGNKVVSIIPTHCDGYLVYTIIYE